MLRVCGDCGTRYAADLDKCPHCGSEDFLWNYEADAAPASSVTVKKQVSK